jgi:eukaryotic-like serine/threonine-protein kinase
MNRRWSPSELETAAKFADDPRIAKALGRAQVFGVAETLTAGPELVRDWRNAWAPGTHPRAAALVAAAVDCRRAGLDDPVSRDLLEMLHVHYLQARGGPALRPESLEEGWAWALQPVRGASSLLVPAGLSEESPGYLAFDYLIDLPDHEPVPPETWDLLISQVGKAEAEKIAAEAFWRVRTALFHAIDSGFVDDVFLKAQAAADRGNYAQAIELLEAEREAGNIDASSQSLRHQIALYSMQAGHVSEAESMFRVILAEAEDSLPPEDEYLQIVRHNIASCAHRSGDLPGALLQFQRILADRERYLGPDAMNTLATRGAIAMIIAGMGNHSEALRLTRDLLADEEGALGKDHTNTLSTRQSMAEYLAATGDTATALEVLEGLLPDLVRALGADHPDVLDSRWQMAQYTARRGKLKEAQLLYKAVLADRERVQGTASPKLEQEREEFETFLKTLKPDSRDITQYE